jgi:2-succinyl-6-hydroxy-2,4-cyclohexadiene-1-carboxylate synthase
MIHQQLPRITIGSIAHPTLLLLHGFMGCKEDWESVASIFGEYFHCVAIDLPGHGQAVNIDWSFPETVDYLIALQTEISPNRPSYLWGYSMGGRLALAAALQSPQSWQRVILESASPGLRDEAAREQRRRSDRGIIRKLQRPDLDFAAFLHHWYAQDIFVGLADAPGFMQMMERRLAKNSLAKPLGARIGYAHALEKLGLGQQPYYGGQLAQFDGPMLVMTGAWDRKFVAIGQEMAAICPAICLEVVENCSHNIHVQQPQQCIKSVHCWLRDNDKFSLDFC